MANDQTVEHYNPNHDDRGRFASSDSAQADVEDEYDAVDSYVGIGYRRINQYLRTGVNTRELEDLTRSDTKHQIVAIDRAFSHAIPLKKDTVVYRVTNVPRRFDSSRIGAVMRDKGYVSTTRSINVAMRGLHGQPGKELLAITIPRGTRVLDIAKQFRGLGYHNEMEILLPRGSKFRVTRNAVLRLVR